jgi:uncharacterized protein (TIGR02246 family)
MPRRLLALFCFLSFVLSTAPLSHARQSSQQKVDSGASISQTLQAVERTWLNAEKTHDAATFEKLVADDWMAIGPDGKTQTKAERAAAISSAKVSDAIMGDMKVRVFGDTAIVTGTDDETSTEGGKEVTDHYVWTDVFIKRNGRWLAVASQTALIK